MDNKLGTMEYRFMSIIWENEPISSMKLVQLCAQQFDWKKSTTYTMLKRLIEKRVVENNDTVVTSLISQAEVRAKESDIFINETFKGSLPGFIAAFFDGKSISDEEAEELKKRLEKKLSVNVEVTPYLKGDLREQITEERRGAFKIQVGIDDATRDKLRRQIKPLIDSNSPDRKFSAADLRATRAKAISEQHEEKLAALREKTRKNTANADAAEVRLTTARARAATANEH